MTTRMRTEDNASARTINDPYDGVHSNGVQLVVTDSGQ